MSATVQISVLSRQYVFVPVTTTVAGTTYDPTGDNVQFAFTAIGSEPVTWYTGSWVIGTGLGQYVAQCLVGPGGAVAVPVGYWQIWIKITDNPEVPILQSGVLQVTE